MLKKYRPANGTEFDYFYAANCANCECDREGRETDGFDGCQIIARSMAFGVDDDHYPQELTLDEHQRPLCTGFIPLGEALPRPRCPLTVDMFGGAV